MAVTLQTLLQAASQTLEGGTAGTLQADAGVTAGVNSVISNIRTDIAGAGSGIGKFLSGVGLSGLVSSAAASANAGAASQETSFLSTLWASLPPGTGFFIVGAAGFVAWLIFRRRR